jgi:hypothetical protein
LEEILEECDLDILGERVLRMFPTLTLKNRKAVELKIGLIRDWEKAELEMEELLEQDPREVSEMFFELRDLLRKVQGLSQDGMELSRRQDRFVFLILVDIPLRVLFPYFSSSAPGTCTRRES